LTKYVERHERRREESVRALEVALNSRDHRGVSCEIECDYLREDCGKFSLDELINKLCKEDLGLVCGHVIIIGERTSYSQDCFQQNYL